jgi:hypothetical protein
MLMNLRHGSEQAIMIVPSGVQAKVTPAPEVLIPALLPCRHSSGRNSFPQPSQTILTGIEFDSRRIIERRTEDILSAFHPCQT